MTQEDALSSAQSATPTDVTIDELGDHVCKHGTALDVHCCHCHSGFIFDKDHKCPPGNPDALQLHRCKTCGTRWLLWPEAVHGGGWNLLDKYSKPGSCCDNAPMGEQIEHLRDLPLTVLRPEPSTAMNEKVLEIRRTFERGECWQLETLDTFCQRGTPGCILHHGTSVPLTFLDEMATTPVPPTIATDEEFREPYTQGYKHAIRDLRTRFERTTSRCSGCGLRWEGQLKGAELCGDCWRKAQSAVHGRPEPSTEPPTLVSGSTIIVNGSRFVLTAEGELKSAKPVALGIEAPPTAKEPKA